jgi:nitrate/nitrite transport system permease protein
MKKQRNSGWIVLCMVLLILFLLVWQLFGGAPGGLPGPIPVAKSAWFFLSDPFYNNGPNDQGIGWLTLYSLARLAAGFLSGALFGVTMGVILGLNPVLYKALNPYIQILRAISPVAWMPLLLYSVQNSGVTAILVVFMASVWPTLANTAFGVSNIKKDYLNIANILQMNPVVKVFKIILPAAGPTIVAGLKISMGSAWVAIVPAEALLGTLGLGYFVWNEWNNLSLTSVIFAVLVIGVVGVILDYLFTRLAMRLAYVD